MESSPEIPTDNIQLETMDQIEEFTQTFRITDTEEVSSSENSPVEAIEDTQNPQQPKNESFIPLEILVKADNKCQSILDLRNWTKFPLLS